MSSRGTLLPIAAAAATGIQVGLAIVATRFVVGQTSPAALALMRYMIGVLCLFPFVLAMPRVRFARRDIAPIALLGIGQFGILIALMNFGLNYIPAGRAALIFATLPLLTMLFAAALGRERLTAAKTAGVVLTIVGVGLALGEKALGEKALHEGAAAEQWIGTLAVFASAVSGAICSVFYRPYLQKYPALPVSAFAMLAAVGFLAVLAAGEGFFGALPRITSAGWAAVVFIGLSSAIGYFLWLWALGHASPTRVTAFLSLSPLTAALLGALLLGEALSMLSLLGLVSVICGLWLAHWESSGESLGSGPK